MRILNRRTIDTHFITTRIDEDAKRFGSQCIILAVDAKMFAPNVWHIYINGGRVDTGKDMIEWIKEACDRGAGEILLTSMDTDGTKNGYDKMMIESLDRKSVV